MGTFITGCLDFTDLTGAQMPQLQLQLDVTSEGKELSIMC